MKTSTQLIGVIVLGIGVIGGVAAVTHHVNQDHHQWMIERMGDKLELDADQHTKLTALVGEMHALRQDLRASRDDDRDEILALLAAPTLDQQRLIAMVNAKTSIIEARTPAVASAVATFSDSLNADQKAELQDWLEWRFIGHRWHSSDGDDEAAKD
jgi:uncharacterized membrane protein